jgi:hypothetical protein
MIDNLLLDKIENVPFHVVFFLFNTWVLILARRLAWERDIRKE